MRHQVQRFQRITSEITSIAKRMDDATHPLIEGHYRLDYYVARRLVLEVTDHLKRGVLVAGSYFFHRDLQAIRRYERSLWYLCLLRISSIADEQNNCGNRNYQSQS